MLSRMEMEARPVRMLASSLRISSTALSIRLRICAISSLIAIVASYGKLTNQRPDLLSFYNSSNITVLPDIEHNNRNVIVFAEGDSRAVHYSESLRQNIHI